MLTWYKEGYNEMVIAFRRLHSFNKANPIPCCGLLTGKGDERQDATWLARRQAHALVIERLHSSHNQSGPCVRAHVSFRQEFYDFMAVP